MNNIILPEKKILSGIDTAICWRNKLKENKYKLAVTNGCFDILHRGHAEYLLAARKASDMLLVLLNSDESVRTLKGQARPINCEYDRAYMLASLEFVDAVLIFNNIHCNKELDLLAPDVYVKGGDYTIETLNSDERQALLKHNTKILFIPFISGHSTTIILNKANNIIVN